MGSKQLVSKSFVAAVAAAFSLAQAQGQKATLEKQLEAEYMLTTPTADNTDIVTTGSVLILQKKGFSAGVVSSRVVTQNTYKDGQIRAGAAAAVRRFGSLAGIGLVPGVGAAAGTAAGAAGGSRDFVNGEKLYVTNITVDRAKNSIVFDLISDSYGDAGRYKASLRFEIPKAALASEDLAQVDPTITQVFKIAPPADQNARNANRRGAASRRRRSSWRKPRPVRPDRPHRHRSPEAPPAPIAAAATATARPCGGKRNRLKSGRQRRRWKPYWASPRRPALRSGRRKFINTKNTSRSRLSTGR